MLRRLFALVAIAFLSACGADHKWATDAEVANARYAPGPPATITLITSINGRSGAGAHSGLLINGSERVLYDPAGSWELLNGGAPERADLHYGMTPAALASYLKFQSDGVFHVILQTVVVPQSVADQAIAAAIAQGSTPKAACSNSISAILHKVPGFEGLPGTFFPKALSKGMAKLPGVREEQLEDISEVNGISLMSNSVVRIPAAAIPATN
jgi:hypothetical protein